MAAGYKILHGLLIFFLKSAVSFVIYFYDINPVKITALNELIKFNLVSK